jgi:polysaccharide pyruvyl transferase WcaK-like protein
MRKNIVVAYAYGTTNAGDHSLTLGALRLLKEIDGDFDISVVSRYSAQEEPSEATRDIAKKFPDVDTVPSPFAFSRSNVLTRLLEKIHGFLLVALVLSLPRIALSFLRHNEALMEIADADLVLCNGGNLFYWNRHRKSLPRLIALAFPMMIARRLGKAYAFLPQTMGPFDGKVPEVLFRDLFEQSEFLLFREPISEGHAASIADLDNTRTAVVPDLAFVSPASSKFREETDRATTLDAEQNPFIAVTLRASQLGDPEVAKDQSVNESATRRVANYMRDVVLPVVKSHDLDVKVVVQTTNDEEVSRRFADFCEEEIDQRVTVITGRRPKRLSDIYEEAELLVGMRLHSMIFALRRDTPVMGIYLKRFGPKIKGTLQMFGLDEYSILLTEKDPEEVHESLERLYFNRKDISKTISEKRREYLRLEEGIINKSLQEI